MATSITLYHGSDHIIEHPTFGLGKQHNDFGLGFYATEHKALAQEWAVSPLHNGFANCYELDLEYLHALHLNSPDYTVLNWMAILVEHRQFALKTPVARRAKCYLLEHFHVNVNAFDLIYGYRADDAYYDYAEAFLNNGITLEQLAKAMRLGELGEQVVLKSQFAFSKLQFKGAVVAEKEIFYPLRRARNEKATKGYFEILEVEKDGLFIQDIIRGGIDNEDPRIPRNVC